MPHDDLTPEEEQVRRLLADSRHAESMPEDVAARLDEVLTGLRDEPAVRTWPSTADLDAARRRRTVRTWLVAAAAVVVVGVGINQVDWSGLGAGDMESSDAGASADEAPAAEAAPDENNAFQSGAWQLPVVRLDPDRFGEQVEDLRSEKIYANGALASADAESQDDADSRLERDAAREARAKYSVLCHSGRLGPGEKVPARYDGQRGWLVFRAPEGDSQVVDLYLCGHDEATRSITLPAP
jgi:hypothetical protein